MDKRLLKQIILDNRKDVENYVVSPRKISIPDFPCLVFVGVRRAGKSFLLYHKMQEMLRSGKTWDDMLYLNFEDDRIDRFTSDDFNLILECQSELSDKKSALFLDEIQNIDGWEKFARRLADKKYSVYITGSNAKMLSKEIMGKLGGRYLPVEVYPLSFSEYLDARNVSYDDNSLIATDSRAKIFRAYDEYLHWGGMPECIGMDGKRNYIASVFQKIYLGDICARNKVGNPNLLRLMLKKMAESVMQPVSYTRIASVLSGAGEKISVPTVSSYIEGGEDAWLLLRLRNVASPFSEKQTICKYYFIDNGILSLFLMNADTLLLENMVALALFRKYGYDNDDERVFFYREKIEVDFYVPDDELAIQVSFSVEKNIETYEREVEALTRLSKVKTCRKRMIITYDDESVAHDEYGDIEIVPYWKWVLQEQL